MNKKRDETDDTASSRFMIFTVKYITIFRLILRIARLARFTWSESLEQCRHFGVASIRNLTLGYTAVCAHNGIFTFEMLELSSVMLTAKVVPPFCRTSLPISSARKFNVNRACRIDLEHFIISFICCTTSDIDRS